MTNKFITLGGNYKIKKSKDGNIVFGNRKAGGLFGPNGHNFTLKPPVVKALYAFIKNNCQEIIEKE